MALNVLIVDDSPVMRDLVARVIKLSGVEVNTRFDAGNGIEALDLMTNASIDLVLADINMPVMNGEEMVRQMNRDERLRKIPVIVISTDGTLRRVSRMRNLGVIGYLQKPFRPEELRDEVERVLEVPRFPPEQVELAAATAASRVLETMCFTVISKTGHSPLLKDRTPIGVAVDFTGSLSGRLHLWTSQEFVQSLPSSLLGSTDTLSPRQPDAVILNEIANMMCGAALTELWSEGEFELASPVVFELDPETVFEGQLVESDDGCIWFALELEPRWTANHQFAS